MLSHTSFPYLFSIYFIVEVKSQINCSNLNSYWSKRSRSEDNEL